MTVFAPSIQFAPLANLEWKSSADVIRFRPDTRPRELLSQSVVSKQFGKREIFLLSDPAAAYRILVQESSQFPKAKPQYRVGYKAFGPGISGTIGEQNKRQRDALSPLFRGEQVKQVAQATRLATQNAIARWTGKDDLDLHKEASRLALEITWATLLGPGTYEGPSPEVDAAIEALARIPKQDFVAGAGVVRELIQSFVSSDRYRSLRDYNPLGAIACPAGWTADPGMSREEIHANAIVMAASGHATTGLSLGWGLWALGQMPQYQQQLRERLRRGENISTELTMLFNEVMRLWTPAAETMRENKIPFSVDGTEIPEGSLLLVSFYALHRRGDIWQDPDRFDPERFRSGRISAIPKGAFMPFSGGEYGCVGMSLAWKELIAAAETVLRSCEIEVAPADAAQVGLEAGTCIYPDRPLRAKIGRTA